LPDAPGQEARGSGTGQAGEPAGAETQRPGGELRRPAELVERDAETGRIVSVIFYFSLKLEFGRETVGLLMVKEIKNPHHRFDKDIDWNLMSDQPDLPPHWLDLVRLCA
jgi:hypothetical protein